MSGELTKEAAIKAVRAAAWWTEVETCGHRGCEGKPTRRCPMPLTRSVPLRRTPLARGGALKRTRMRVYRPAVANAEARGLVAARSGGRCEAGLFGCAGQATDVHHRITKKAGGRKGAAAIHHDRASNALLLCRPCHTWVTDNPLPAYELGLSLKEHHVTQLEPVVYRGDEWVVLGDDGSVVGFP